VKQQRKRRVDEALRHVLAEGVDELSDPAVGFVTVTFVDVTADLEHPGTCQGRVAVQGGPGAALAKDSRPDLSV
jgi:hypothetical protein